MGRPRFFDFKLLSVSVSSSSLKRLFLTAIHLPVLFLIFFSNLPSTCQPYALQDLDVDLIFI